MIVINEPRILFYDLEISPILGWTYEVWDTNVIKVERSSYIMCFSYQWYGQPRVRNVAQVDFEEHYKKFPYDDSKVVGILWDLMNEADIVVAHNASKFDNRIATARFMNHGLTPPSPYKTVDTLAAARRYFRFASNSLASLCDELEKGSKPTETHGKLWYRCVSGDKEAWRKMKKYNDQDVKLLVKLYDEMKPYISNHPTVAFDGEGCPRCGSYNGQYRGYTHTAVSSFRRRQCLDCGAWYRERVAEKMHPKYVSIL